MSVNAFELFAEIGLDTGGFDRSIAKVKSSLNSSVQALRQAGTEATDFGKRLSGVGSNAQQAGAGVERTNERLRDSRGRFIKAGEGAKTFGTNVGTATSKLDTFGSKLDRVGGKMEGIGRQMAMGISLPLIGAGIAAAKFAADLEQQVANISTIKPDIDTSAVFNSLNEMSTRVPQTADQLGAALYNVFSSMTVSQQEALSLTEQFAKGAVGAMTDAETFGTSIVGVMNAYKMNVSEAAHVSDVFFNTVSAGVVTGDELARELGTVSKSAKNAGLNIDELGAFIAGVTKEGGSASENINNLHNLFQKIVTKDAQAELNSLGIKTVDATGKFLPMIDVVDQLGVALAGMTEEAAAQKLQEIFPDSQARTGALTVISQSKMIREQIKLNAEALGISEEAYKKMSATTNSQFALMKNSVVASLTRMGAEILPVIMPAIQWIAREVPNVVTNVMNAFNNLGSGGKTAAAVFVGFAVVLGPVLATVGAFVAAIGVIGIKIMAVAAVVGAAAGIIAGLWVTNFGGIQEKTRAVVANVEASVQRLTKNVVAWWTQNLPLIQKTTQTVLNNVQAFWTANGAKIMQVVDTAWNLIKDTIGGVLTVIGNIVKLAMQVINSDWSGAWSTLGDIVMSALRATVGQLSSLGGLFLDALHLAFNVVWGIQAWLFDQAGNLGKAIGNGLVNGIKSMIGAVVSASATLGAAAIGATAGAIDSNSPSREFHKLGIYIGQGFSHGIEDGIPLVTAASKKLADAALLTVANAGVNIAAVMRTALGTAASLMEPRQKKKGDKPATADESNDAGLQLLRDLVIEQAKLNDVTRVGELNITLQDAAYAKLDDRLRAVLVAKTTEVDLATRNAEAQKMIKDALDAQREAVMGAKTEYQKIEEFLKDPEIARNIDARTAAMMREAAIAQDMATALERMKKTISEMPPLLLFPGQDQWGNMSDDAKPPGNPGDPSTDIGKPPEMSRWMKWSDEIQGITDQIGNIFAQAVQQWDGTLSGFFKSIAKGFQAMLLDMAAQIMKSIVINFIGKLVGSIGGFMGGGGVAASSGTGKFASAGSGGGGGFFGGLLGGIGGLFGKSSTGGGGGSSKGVSFGAPERVIPTTPVGGSTSKGGRGDVHQTVNMTVHARDAESFKHSQAQIQKQLKRQMRSPAEMTMGYA